MMLTNKIESSTIPKWASDRVNPQWWKEYEDPELNRDITIAFSESADLGVMAARLEQADARAKVARVAAWPRLNVGYGYRAGRAREVDFGPYDLRPWTGAVQLQWELDLWGKLKRARQSADFARDAVFWDLAATRLLLASRIAESRFRIYRLHDEIQVFCESIEANASILKILRDREKAGLISMTDVHRAHAEHEKLKRGKEELQRLHQLAVVELESLLGGTERDKKPRGKLPLVPGIPAKPFCDLVQSHPTLLSAEAKVRSAFGLEEVARLDLLPSFTLRGNLMGASPHFFLDQFAAWERQIGPSLDLPVFDPARRATLRSRRENTEEAVQLYRSALIEVVGDLDSAYISLQSRRRQLEFIDKEVAALSAARKDVEATFQGGIVSQIEVLESERSYLRARRARIVLHQSILNDHLALVRALGGAE